METATELTLASGRKMLPYIPGRSLLGLVRRPEEEVKPGDIIVWTGNGPPAVRRVIEKDGECGDWLCMADNGRGVDRVGTDRYRGTVAWRCWRGHKKNLAARSGPFLSLFLGIRRLEIRLALRNEVAARVNSPRRSPVRQGLFIPLAVLSLFRRLLCARLHTAPERHPDRREASYLLHSLRAALFHGNERLDPPPDGLDWDTVLSLAIHHRITGIVGPLWAGLPAESRPPGRVAEALCSHSRTTEEVWDRSLELLKKIFPAFHKRGIPALLLKGPVVARTCYARPTDRPFGDLDILVPEEKRDAAREVLAGIGIRPKAGSLVRGLLARGHFHMAFSTPLPFPPSVELHWGLVDKANFYCIDTAELFRRARTVELPGVTVGAPSYPDEFIYLCLHLYRHGLIHRPSAGEETEAHLITCTEADCRLIWFVDLVGYLSRIGRESVQRELWSRATSWNVEKEVSHCLRVSGKLFPAAGIEGLRPLVPEAARGIRGRTPPSSGRRSRSALPHWTTRTLPLFVIRPVRLLELAPLFFPPISQVRRFYGPSTRLELMWRCLAHPFRMFGRVFLGR